MADTTITAAEEVVTPIEPVAAEESAVASEPAPAEGEAAAAADAAGEAAPVPDADAAAALATIAALKVSHPDNRMAKHFTEEYYTSLPDDKKPGLLLCCKSGYENADSGMGLYAMAPNDYEEYQPYFDKVRGRRALAPNHHREGM